jgi:hypothetical protein
VVSILHKYCHSTICLFLALSLYIIFIGLITLTLITLLIVLCIKRNWLIEKVIDNYGNYLNSSEVLDNDKNRNLTRAMYDLFFLLDMFVLSRNDDYFIDS